VLSPTTVTAARNLCQESSTQSKQVTKTHKKSSQIQRTKAHTLAWETKKKKKQVSSPNLSDTDYTSNNDDDNDEWEVDLNRSVTGLDDKDKGEEEEEHEPDLVSLNDTNIDFLNKRTDCDLLECLEEATRKDFNQCSTQDLQTYWKAYSEDQEAVNETEVQYPQIQRLETYEMSPGAGLWQSK
ncbi:hypothetical protein FRC10_008248, partial [Ceratobasidium sp. 414]